MPDKRSNTFEIILYPDSLPDYNEFPHLFEQIIENTSVQCILSPLHNLDKYNKADEFEAQKMLQSDDLSSSERERLEKIKEGSYKKPHYHLVIYYGKGANKTPQQVIDDFCIPLNAPQRVFICKTLRGRVRYLIHLDNPSKFQYHLSDIKVFNGFDVDDYFDLSNKQIDELSFEILTLIKDYKIQTYQQLLFFTKSKNSYYRYCVNHSLFFTSYFKDIYSSDPEHLEGFYLAGKSILSDSERIDL